MKQNKAELDRISRGQPKEVKAQRRAEQEAEIAKKACRLVVCQTLHTLVIPRASCNTCVLYIITLHMTKKMKIDVFAHVIPAKAVRPQTLGQFILWCSFLPPVFCLYQIVLLADSGSACLKLA